MKDYTIQEFAVGETVMKDTPSNGGQLGVVVHYNKESHVYHIVVDDVCSGYHASSIAPAPPV